ncbi:MAG: PAS domain S-box protein, partial [Phycisphaerales bacterium]|nr:PAS domain S-box protein [Phycisphaerales bacterium]
MKDREWAPADLAGQMDAIRKSMAVIEFEVDGTIIWANDNFCDTLGYTLSEITGEHHRIFVRDEERNGPEYKSFWRRLGAGEYVAGDFRRVAKDGCDIWIRASYNPVFDENGELLKVVKFATNITEQMRQNMDAQGRIDAVEKSMAVIEFNPDGTIIRANDNFCMTVGYSESEIRGKHHRMFVDPKYAEGPEYRTFWEKLNRGEFDSGEYKRFGKGGREIYIQASYNPIFDEDGNVVKVVKFATDITEQTLRNADYEGQVNAIHRSQAVIEFNLDGTILHANENFCNAMGYQLSEIKGQHHRVFMPKGEGDSASYRQFWEKLGRGEYQAGEFKRVGKGGREIWIQASYNPIFDAAGRPYKVVKFAVDVTEQKLRNADFAGQISAIGKSQAVIEFDMDGTIRVANENFCGAMGYQLSEIQGKHHRMFVEESFGKSSDYRDFWAALNRGEYQAGNFKRIGKGGK